MSNMASNINEDICKVNEPVIFRIEHNSIKPHLNVVRMAIILSKFSNSDFMENINMLSNITREQFTQSKVSLR